MMTKTALISQLENAKNNYILGLAGISLFGSPEAYPILEKNHAAFGTYTVDFAQVVRLLRNTKDREIAIKEFLTSQIRALIKESFELIKDYCDCTGQAALFKAEPWYQFARMIRNCLSHNFKFEFTKYDKGLLPVSWNARTITSGAFPICPAPSPSPLPLKRGEERVRKGRQPFPRPRFGGEGQGEGAI